MVNIDFKVGLHPDSNELGVYLPTSKRIIIYLPHHSSIEQIYDTIEHETIHAILDKYKHDSDMDEYQEHSLIFALNWIDEYV